jgi:hypothetical protein
MSVAVMSVVVTTAAVTIAAVTTAAVTIRVQAGVKPRVTPAADDWKHAR